MNRSTAPPALRPLVDSRNLLAAYPGEWVRCRAVAMRDSRRPAATLVHRLDLAVGGEWVRVADHAWLARSALCNDYGRGVVLEFTALVHAYRSDDPETGQRVQRYGLERAGQATVFGPAVLVDLLGELCSVWSWERVADTVANLHGGGT